MVTFSPKMATFFFNPTCSKMATLLSKMCQNIYFFTKMCPNGYFFYPKCVKINFFLHKSYKNLEFQRNAFERNPLGVNRTLRIRISTSRGLILSFWMVCFSHFSFPHPTSLLFPHWLSPLTQEENTKVRVVSQRVSSSSKAVHSPWRHRAGLWLV